MWRKNLILSLVFVLALPFGKAGAASTDLQDEAQSQVSASDKGVTTAPATETETETETETTLAVPADVKWAHHLATGFAALGTIAGVVQLGYIIGKYWREIDQVLPDERWDCQWKSNVQVSVADEGGITIQNMSGWIPDATTLLQHAVPVGIMTPVFALAARWLHRHPPVIKPETIFTQSPLENIAKFLGVVLVGGIATKAAVYSLGLGVSFMFDPKVPKGLLVQIAAFGGMLLCKTYAVLRVGYLNHKAAEELDQSIIAA